MNRYIQYLEHFKKHLQEEEKSDVTVEKYLRDVRAFLQFMAERELSKATVMSWKQQLIEKGYAVRSINSMLASVNSFLSFLERPECRVKSLRMQREIYQPEALELTKDEYYRLLRASIHRPRLNMLLQTIAGTGIRVSELRFFTVEAVEQGEVHVSAKGKNRVILLPKKLKKSLLQYARKQRIQSDVIFCTRKGQPLNRSNIWSEMKALCVSAGVDPRKVFPHNLRKLFARCFYGIDHDIAKLADILGHSSVNTTRIYIMSSGREHRQIIDKLKLVI